MESRTKFLGHPIHPMLVVFPLGLFITAVIFDIIYLITGIQLFTVIAFYDIAGGILGGLTAAVFGFHDWLHIPRKTRANRIGTVHGAGNVTLVALFLVSWILRLGSPRRKPTVVALIFSFAGVCLGFLTAWLGGELVYRLGVAPDKGANLNASNSLSGKPASKKV